MFVAKPVEDFRMVVDATIGVFGPHFRLPWRLVSQNPAIRSHMTYPILIFMDFDAINLAGVDFSQ